MHTFAKYEGCGNGFILFDDREKTFPLGDLELIRRLCHRNKGIGADGLLLLQRDPHADFRMRIFNADGSEAGGCGNGLRCLVRFLADIGFPQRPYAIAMGHQVVQAEFVEDEIAIEYAQPQCAPALHRLGPWEVHSIDTGVPHAVVFVPDVSAIDLAKEGPFLRRHPVFAPEGTNVNFAALLPSGGVSVRTFERGVEGETLACGTGALAVALVAQYLHGLASPIRIETRGGLLTVYLSGARMRLVGPARRIEEPIQ